MVVGGKQSQRPDAVRLVKVFGDRPSDADAVVGAGSAPDFIQQDQTAFSQVVQDGGRFIHLDHEGGFAAADVVRGADASENAVEDAEVCGFGGDEGPGLRHQRDQGRLTQKGTFT